MNRCAVLTRTRSVATGTAGLLAAAMTLAPVGASADHGGGHVTLDQTPVCDRGATVNTVAVQPRPILHLHNVLPRPAPKNILVKAPKIGKGGSTAEQTPPDESTTTEAEIPVQAVHAETPVGDLDVPGTSLILTVERCGLDTDLKVPKVSP